MVELFWEKRSVIDVGVRLNK